MDSALPRPMLIITNLDSLQILLADNEWCRIALMILLTEIGEKVVQK